MVLHVVTGCYTVFHGATRCHIVVHRVSSCYTVLHGGIRFYRVLHGVSCCNTVNSWCYTVLQGA